MTTRLRNRRPPDSPGYRGAPPGTKKIPKTHPLRRFFARTVVDMFILGLLPFAVSTKVVSFIAPRLADLYFTTLPAVVFVLCVAAESFLLYAVSTTPGKRLFNIYVRDRRGRNLTVGHALARTLYVWITGLGLCVPILSFFTLYYAYRRLTKTGSTLWDEGTESVVTHEDMRWPQKILGPFVVLIILAVLAVVVFVPETELTGWLPPQLSW